MKRAIMLSLLILFAFCTFAMASPVYFAFTDGTGDGLVSGTIVNVNSGTSTYTLAFQPAVAESGSYSEFPVDTGVTYGSGSMAEGIYDVVLYQGDTAIGKTSAGDAEWTLVGDGGSRLTLNWTTAPVVNVITTNPGDSIEAMSLGPDNPVPLPGTLIMGVVGLLSLGFVRRLKKQEDF